MKILVITVFSLIIGGVLTGAGAVIFANNNRGIKNELKVDSQAAMLKEIRDDVKIIKGKL